MLNLLEMYHAHTHIFHFEISIHSIELPLNEFRRAAKREGLNLLFDDINSFLTLHLLCF
jgi:hypothetical protein